MGRDAARGLRQFYRASRSRFFFIIFGIPIIILAILVFFSYMVFFTTMLFVSLGVIAVAMLPRAVKSKKFYLYGLKVSLIFLIAFFGLVPNPLIWGEQIYRRLDHRQLITPNEPAVQALNDSSNLWKYINDTYHATPQQFKTWSVRDQARRILHYIEHIIKYTYDIDNDHVFDHVSTPKETLANHKDDCQGISCVLVSLLLYMGYDAFVCECPFHWYARVYYVNTTTNTTTYTDVYRSSSQPDPFYMFNETETIYPENILWTINTSFAYDYIPIKYAAIVNNKNGTLNLAVIGSSFPETSIPSWVTWIVIFGVCMLLGIIVTIYLKIPGYKKLKFPEKIESTISFAVSLFIGFISILFVPAEAFLYFALVMVGISVFLADSGIIFKALSWIKKTVTAHHAIETSTR